MPDRNIRDEIQRRGNENLRRKAEERISAAENIAHPPPAPQRQQPHAAIKDTALDTPSFFNPERFTIKLIIATGVVWFATLIIYGSLSNTSPDTIWIIAIASLIGIPLNIALIYVQYLIIRIVAKIFWEFMGCLWMFAFLGSLLGLLAVLSGRLPAN